MEAQKSLRSFILDETKPVMRTLNLPDELWMSYFHGADLEFDSQKSIA